MVVTGREEVGSQQNERACQPGSQWRCKQGCRAVRQDDHVGDSSWTRQACADQSLAASSQDLNFHVPSKSCQQCFCRLSSQPFFQPFFQAHWTHSVPRWPLCTQEPCLKGVCWLESPPAVLCRAKNRQLQLLAAWPAAWRQAPCGPPPARLGRLLPPTVLPYHPAASAAHEDSLAIFSNSLM